jgi:predicted PurR-regulated permease PerM
LIILPVVINQLTGFLKSLPALWDSAINYADTHFNESVRHKLEQIGILTPHAAEAASDTSALIAPAVGDSATSLEAADNEDLSGQIFTWLKSMIGLSLPALAKAGSQLQAFFAKVAGLAIIPVYLFYLLDMRRDFIADLRRESNFLSPSLRDDISFLIEQFIGILISYFRGQFLIGMILGVLMATGFTCVGLKFGLLIGLMIGLFNVIPYLGTMIGLGVSLPLAYFQQDGGLGTLLWVAGVFVVVQSIEGYFLTPRIMGKTTGLHPMVIIFSIFFWGLALDGLLGMILAVPLTAFFVVFWRLMKTKYLPRLAEMRKG